MRTARVRRPRRTRGDREARDDRSGRSDRGDRDRPERARAPRVVRAAARWRRTASRSASASSVEPRQIVGALANEGGLSRDDFGHIDIRPDFSIVELPADLSPTTLDRLEATRISGKLIEMRARPRRPRAPGRDDRGSDRDERPSRKPRH